MNKQTSLGYSLAWTSLIQLFQEGRYLPTVNCGNPNKKAFFSEKKKNKSADFNTEQVTITEKDQKCKKGK